VLLEVLETLQGPRYAYLAPLDCTNLRSTPLYAQTVLWVHFKTLLDNLRVLHVILGRLNASKQTITSCFSCSARFYQSIGGQSQCLSCSPGSFSNSSGISSCLFLLILCTGTFSRCQSNDYLQSLWNWKLSKSCWSIRVLTIPFREFFECFCSDFLLALFPRIVSEFSQLYSLQCVHSRKIPIEQWKFKLFSLPSRILCKFFINDNLYCM
jgi:hypothetical protein